MGESLSCVNTSVPSFCAHDLGQDSPKHTSCSVNIKELNIRNRSTNQVAGNSLLSSEIILKLNRSSDIVLRVTRRSESKIVRNKHTYKPADHSGEVQNGLIRVRHGIEL